jgi:hypothetical protein
MVKKIDQFGQKFRRNLAKIHNFRPREVEGKFKARLKGQNQSVNE